MGLIYKLDITDSAGEIYHYVGQTTKTLEERKYGHYHNKSGNMLVDDMLKANRGRDVWTILEDNIPDYMLNVRERYWVQKYDTCDIGKSLHHHGLNQTCGGQDWRERPRGEIVCEDYGLEVLKRYATAKTFDDTRESTMVIRKQQKPKIKKRKRQYWIDYDEYRKWLRWERK